MSNLRLAPFQYNTLCYGRNFTVYKLVISQYTKFENKNINVIQTILIFKYINYDQLCCLKVAYLYCIMLV